MSTVLLGRLLQEKIIVPGNRFPFAERETWSPKF